MKQLDFILFCVQYMDYVFFPTSIVLDMSIIIFGKPLELDPPKTTTTTTATLLMIIITAATVACISDHRHHHHWHHQSINLLSNLQGFFHPFIYQTNSFLLLSQITTIGGFKFFFWRFLFDFFNIFKSKFLIEKGIDGYKQFYYLYKIYKKLHLLYTGCNCFSMNQMDSINQSKKEKKNW